MNKNGKLTEEEMTTFKRRSPGKEKGPGETKPE